MAGRNWHCSLVVLFLAFVLVAFSCIEYTHHLHQQYVQRDEQAKARKQLAVIRAKVESLIVSDIYLANSIPIVVSTHPQISDSQWQDVAQSIIQRSKHISGVFLSPDNVIKYAYPMSEFAYLIGFDYQTSFKYWHFVQRAMESKEVVLEDTIKLRNGMSGIVARVPIFLDPPFYQHYWGISSLIINLDTLLAEVGVAHFEAHYNIAIAIAGQDGEPGEVIYGDNQALKEAFATEVISFADGHWILSASTEHGFVSRADWFQRHVIRLIGYSALLLVSLAFLVVYRLYCKANELSLHDDLTGLPNRRYFMFTLERHFTLAQQSKGHEHFALLNIDLDKFKQINDDYGHDAGDAVLCAVGERLQTALRASDIVARVGGDEFLVLLPRVREEQHVKDIVHNLCRQLVDKPVEYHAMSIRIQASLGYALYHDEMDSVEAIIKVADNAMYQQKFNNISH